MDRQERRNDSTARRDSSNRERETERDSLIDRETFYNNKRAHRIFYFKCVIESDSKGK